MPILPLAAPVAHEAGQSCSYCGLQILGIMSRVLQLAPGWGLGAQVHDFGFLAFDPGLLQFMKSGRIPLDPAAARVGLEVRVVGNDSGEKVRRVRPSSRSVPLRTLCHPSSPEGAAEQP